MTELEAALNGPQAHAARQQVARRLSALEQLCEKALRQGDSAHVIAHWIQVRAAVSAAQQVMRLIGPDANSTRGGTLPQPTQPNP